MPLIRFEHIHPILVNFTAALVPVSLASDVLGRAFKKQSLNHAAWWSLLYAACITPFTALAGLMWKRSLGDALPAAQINLHMRLGIGLAVALLVMALWRWSIERKSGIPGAAYLIFSFLAVAALMYQGSLGGELVFGP